MRPMDDFGTRPCRSYHHPRCPHARRRRRGSAPRPPILLCITSVVDYMAHTLADVEVFLFGVFGTVVTRLAKQRRARAAERALRRHSIASTGSRSRRSGGGATS
ncbi:hypothetical protein PsYK624_054550 [Phanerochaete sordida]|uniref:Uncharacterized protein n=1 Tax=Phanerochaete sordida TaxID=48140 RepID=A0A9P3G6Y0_9APHY|nr:hypothetical protein PsYK624_054550 [Phanerochaete sordida]